MSENTYIRKLEINDYHKGYLKLLNQLTSCTDLTFERFTDIFHTLKNENIYVIEINNKIIATGTLLIEQKFIHNGSKVGHIEDIVVDKDMRGEKFGQKIILHLINEARKNECYKSILNCSHKNVGFYEKLGFEISEVEMRIDFV